MKKESSSKSKAKDGVYSMIFVAIVLAIVVFINLIFSTLNIKFDVTKDKLFTVSNITIDLLKNLNSKIKITVLADESNIPVDYKEIVNKYKEYSKNVEIIYKDPQKNPRYFDIYTSDRNFSEQSIIVEKVGSVPLKYKIINSLELFEEVGGIKKSAVEKGITDAIGYVTSDRTRNIYFTKGHEEMELHSYITKMITDRDYEIKDINLNNEDIDFDNTDMILMISPKIDISSNEVEKIKDYLSKGGRMLFAVDFVRDELLNIRKIINTYGLDFKRSIILEGDKNKTVSNAPYILIPTIEDHKITENIKQGPIYLSYCMPIVELETKKSTLNITPIFKTSALSYDKTAGDAGQSFEKKEGDGEGPYNVAAVVVDKAESTGAAKDTEIMVISTSAFVDIEFIAAGASELDLDILFNSITFMTDNPYDLKVVEKINTGDLLKKTPTVNNAIVIGLIIVLLPIMFFISGGIVWYKRKSL